MHPLSEMKQKYDDIPCPLCGIDKPRATLRVISRLLFGGEAKYGWDDGFKAGSHFMWVMALIGILTGINIGMWIIKHIGVQCW